jgi:hypothetical protein
VVEGDHAGVLTCSERRHRGIRPRLRRQQGAVTGNLTEKDGGSGSPQPRWRSRRRAEPRIACDDMCPRKRPESSIHRLQRPRWPAEEGCKSCRGSRRHRRRPHFRRRGGVDVADVFPDKRSIAGAASRFGGLVIGAFSCPWPGVDGSYVWCPTGIPMLVTKAMHQFRFDCLAAALLGGLTRLTIRVSKNCTVAGRQARSGFRHTFATRARALADMQHGHRNTETNFLKSESVESPAWNKQPIARC